MKKDRTVEVRRFVRPEVDTEGATFIAGLFKPTKKQNLMKMPDRMKKETSPLKTTRQSMIMTSLETQNKFPKNSNLAYANDTERF